MKASIHFMCLYKGLLATAGKGQTYRRKSVILYVSEITGNLTICSTAIVPVKIEQSVLLDCLQSSSIVDY